MLKEKQQSWANLSRRSHPSLHSTKFFVSSPSATSAPPRPPLTTPPWLAQQVMFAVFHQRVLVHAATRVGVCLLDTTVLVSVLLGLLAKVVLELAFLI
jgi:hypothetical protein